MTGSNFAIEAALRQTAEVAPLTADDIPIKPKLWHVVVEPLRPKQRSAGGIIISDEATKVEKIQNTVGRVIAMGDLAFKGRTTSGLNLMDDSVTVNPGDLVLFARYTGQEIKLRDAKGGADRLIILIADTELLALVTDPDMIRFWI